MNGMKKMRLSHIWCIGSILGIYLLSLNINIKILLYVFLICSNHLELGLFYSYGRWFNKYWNLLFVLDRSTQSCCHEAIVLRHNLHRYVHLIIFHKDDILGSANSTRPPEMIEIIFQKFWLYSVVKFNDYIHNVIF